MFHFDIPGLKKDVKELQEKTYKEDLWDDVKAAQTIMQEIKNKSTKIDEYEELLGQIEDTEILLELIIEEDDFSDYKEVQKSINRLQKKVDDFKIATLLSGDFDDKNAILSIHSGAGGLEAQDWAEMLLRMYRRWADARGFKVETLDLQADTEGGIKAVTLLIEGYNAYGYLRSEKGVHRLVRISPFDTAGKRHTSFASIDIYPELNDDVEIEINESDLKIDTYRASGAGGQHVNTTDSAIRITHIPTGVVVSCQSERSQHTNKATAMNMLKAKLITIKEDENKERIDDLQGSYSQIAWGSQIRSYVFHPYSMIKDHRTDAEVGDVSKVMDGSIDYFINEYLKFKALQ